MNDLLQPSIQDVNERMCGNCDALVCAGCPVYEMDKLAALRARVGELEQERDEAINNANNYRARVFDFLDGMTNESQMTQDTEEGRGLEPTDREQYRNAIAYIRKAFENHNYLTEAKLAGSFAGFTVYASGDEAAALAKGAK